MRFIFVFFCLTAGCASPKPLFSSTDYAYPGTDVVCAKIERTPCGLALTQCSNGLRFECVTNTIIVSIDQIRESQKAREEHLQ